MTFVILPREFNEKKYHREGRGEGGGGGRGSKYGSPHTIVIAHDKKPLLLYEMLIVPK